MRASIPGRTDGAAAAPNAERSLLPSTDRRAHTTHAPREICWGPDLDGARTGRRQVVRRPVTPPGRDDRPPKPGGDPSRSMARGDKSGRTRTGSRPITHGCSTRDPRPGSPSADPFARSRRPFAGPWSTPRVPRFAASRLVHTLRSRQAGGQWVGGPCSRRRWSEAWTHRGGTNVPGYNRIPRVAEMTAPEKKMKNAPTRRITARRRSRSISGSRSDFMIHSRPFGSRL